MAQCSQSLILHVTEPSRVREVLTSGPVEIPPVSRSVTRVASCDRPANLSGRRSLCARCAASHRNRQRKEKGY
jgi:hypothetical protein